MMSGPTTLRAALATCLLTALVAGVGSARFRLRAEQTVPPVTYVCPMSEHSQVVEDKPGKCPICAMVLVPVRIELTWSCPIHPVVMADKPGQCPIDKRDLVQVSVSVYWTCADKPEEHLTDA